MQEYCIKLSSNTCFGYLLESPHWGNSNKYPKHMFYEQIRIKQGLSYKDSLQQQIHFNGNIFGNKCCRCDEGSLYLSFWAENLIGTYLGSHQTGNQSGPSSPPQFPVLVSLELLSAPWHLLTSVTNLVYLPCQRITLLSSLTLGHDLLSHQMFSCQ